MFELSVEGHFDSAHFLRGYGGKCEGLHGHRFRAVVGIRAEKTNSIGIVYDFVELRLKLRGITSQLDHTLINDLPAFQQENPSSENLARYIYRELKPKLEGVTLAYVDVWESPESRARFIP